MNVRNCTVRTIVETCFNWRGNRLSNGSVHCLREIPAASVSHSLVPNPLLRDPQIMTPAKKTTTAAADAGEKKKEYKYQQEISQMVRTQTRSRAPGPPNCFWLFATDVRLW